MSTGLTFEVLDALRKQMDCDDEYFLFASTENGYKWEVVTSSYGNVTVWTKEEEL